MLTPFLALTRKDVKLFFGNRRALLVTIAAPIAIASFFGYLFGGGGSTEPSRIAVLAVDQDGSAISREIAAGLTADKNLEVKPSTLEPAREAGIKPVLGMEGYFTNTSRFDRPKIKQAIRWVLRYQLGLTMSNP